MRHDSRHIWLTGVCCLQLGVGLLSADDGQPTGQSSGQSGDDSTAIVAEIQQLIRDLDSDQFSKRNRATKRLLKLGRRVIPLLQKAAASRSTEVRFRARKIVETIEVRALTKQFTSVGKSPDEKIEIEEGMWLISRIIDPEVKRATLTRQLDELAALVRKQLGPDPQTADPQKVMAAFQQVLFEKRVTGNVENYDHPDNSSLYRVLKTGKGLPIILAHVGVSVGQRIGVPIEGMPVPGHYMARYNGSKAPDGFPKTDILFDPFEQAKTMTANEVAKAWPGFNPTFHLQQGPNRDVVLRMLANLQADFIHIGDTRRAQQVGEYRSLIVKDVAP